MEIFSPYLRSAEEIDPQIVSLLKDPPSGDDFRDICRQVLGLIDLTSLEGTDHDLRIEALCQQARISLRFKDLPDTAAVCVFPNFIRQAAKMLAGSGVRIAAVAGAFPHGQTGLKVRVEEVKYAAEEGADEIDIVINRGLLLSGRYTELYDELAALRDAAGKKKLKVILETGELPSVAMVRKAAEIAIMAGADFIKTSTGKIPTGATPRAMLVMLDTIREFHQKTKKIIGIKPAGGIREPAQAVEYYILVKKILGPAWLTKEHFRIGASSLAARITDRLA